MHGQTGCAQAAKNPQTVAHYRRAEELPAEVIAFTATVTPDQLAWYAPWYQNPGTGVPPLGRQAHLFILHGAAAPSAVLPRAISEKPPRGLGALRRRLAAPSNNYTALYQPALAAQLDISDLVCTLRRVMRALSATSRVHLAPMDVDSRDYHLLRRALQKMHWPTFGFFCFGNWYPKDLSSYESYLKGRSGNLRNRLVARRCVSTVARRLGCQQPNRGNTAKHGRGRAH